MNTKTIKLMAGRKFLLKPNTCIWVDRLNLHITNENLTDELAINLLKKNRGYLKFFHEVPEGWDKTAPAPVPTPVPVKKDYEVLKPEIKLEIKSEVKPEVDP